MWQKFLKVEMTKVRGKKKKTDELTLNDERKSKKGHMEMSSFLREITSSRECH